MFRIVQFSPYSKAKEDNFEKFKKEIANAIRKSAAIERSECGVNLRSFLLGKKKGQKSFLTIV